MDEVLSIIVSSSRLTNTFGRMVAESSPGLMLFWVILFLFVLVGAARLGRASSDPALAPYVARPADRKYGGEGGPLSHWRLSAHDGDNVNSQRGIPTRWSIAPPPWADGSTGEHAAGEMVFAPGTGSSSVLMVALVGLFLTGLVIGAPEYLGKRLSRRK